MSAELYLGEVVIRSRRRDVEENTMNAPFLGLSLFATVLLLLFGAVSLSTTADAHKRGPLCRYQVINSNGYAKPKVTYCHHLPARYQRPPPRPSVYLYFGPGGFYYGDRAPPGGGQGQNQVCLVTFFDRTQVAAGADANVEQARLLPRSVAERRVASNDRNRIFEYGNPQKTRDTCRYLDGLNNVSQSGGGQDLVCLVTFFDRTQVAAGADANVEKANILPRSVAERRVASNDRNRIFEYGTAQKTNDTCQYLNGLNN